MEREGASDVREVAVPVAFAEDGGLVRPDAATPGGRYACPGCGARLTLRAGPLRRPHFAHRRGDGCSAESVLHRTAKHLVVHVVNQWKVHGGPRPCVSRPCPTFGCAGGVVQDLPDDVTHASPEVRLEAGIVADVVLYRGDAPAAAVEIVATNAVAPDKARRLGIPWVELRAADLLDRPYWWVAHQDGLDAFVCPACARRGRDASRRLDLIQHEAVRLAERTGLRLPPSPPYHFVPHGCWRCGAEMVAFLWPGASHSPRRPPSPIPSTVQHRVTEGAGNYWANCCPSCSAVQGDYYLGRDNAAYRLVRELATEAGYDL